MESVLYAARSLSPMLSGLLIASVWQGLLLTGCVGLALHATRGVSPAARARVWTAVLLVVLVLPSLALLLPRIEATGHPQLHVAQGWSTGLLVFWAVLAIWRGLRLAASAVRLSRLAQNAVPVSVNHAIASLLDGPRRAQLCVSTELNRPGVAGFFRPKVLLPEGLLETLSPQELEQVVLHEMEHLRRRDDWWNLLQGLSLVVLPLNPALVWIDRQLCRERELACDDGVLAATRGRRAYAACLVKLAEESLVRRGLALALSALGTRARDSELVCRVRRILAGPERVATAGSVRFAVGSLVVAVLVTAGLLARSPELVSFDAAPAAMAQASEPPLLMQRTTLTGRMIPASATMGVGTLGPFMANAVFTKSGSTAARSLATVRTQTKRMQRARHVLPAARAWTSFPVKALAPGVRPWEAVPVRALLDEAVPPVAVPAVARENTPAIGAAPDVPTARVIVTEFQISQPVFAAIPVRGGWLILQL